MPQGRPYLLCPVARLRGPRNPVPGVDVAGTVVAVGPGVTRFSVGDEVFGFGRGTFGEDGGNWTGMDRQVRPLARSPFLRQRLTMVTPRRRSSDLDRLTAFIEAGTVTASIGATYPLDQVPEAMGHLEGGEARKVAITIATR